MKSRTTKIKAENVFYIKLGSGGRFEKECLFSEPNKIKLSYNEVPHDLCINKAWDQVHEFFTKDLKSALNSATNHTNQIQRFYESDDSTLWITFHADRLWWCFSKQEIIRNEDNTKTRPVVGSWSDKNIEGETLSLGKLSGKLTQVQAFRGTICTVSEKEYLLAKINCEQSKELEEVEEAKQILKQKLIRLVEHLTWKDFELLIDLIFRQSGWRRMRQLAKGIKTIDLELSAAVTGEKAVVQIKHRANLGDFKKYLRETTTYDGVSQNYFIVSQPSQDLKSFENETDVKIIFGSQIADLVLAAGLTDWIITRLT